MKKYVLLVLVVFVYVLGFFSNYCLKFFKKDIISRELVPAGVVGDFIVEEFSKPNKYKGIVVFAEDKDHPLVMLTQRNTPSDEYRVEVVDGSVSDYCDVARIIRNNSRVKNIEIKDKVSNVSLTLKADAQVGKLCDLSYTAKNRGGESLSSLHDFNFDGVFDMKLSYPAGNEDSGYFISYEKNWLEVDIIEPEGDSFKGVGGNGEIYHFVEGKGWVASVNEIQE